MSTCYGQIFTGDEEALGRPAHSNSWFFQPFLRIFYDVHAASILLSCPLLLLLPCPLVLEDVFSGLSPCHLPAPQVIPTVCSLSPMRTCPHPDPSPGVACLLLLNWGLREILTFFKGALLRVKPSGSARLGGRDLEASASWCPFHRLVHWLSYVTTRWACTRPETNLSPVSLTPLPPNRECSESQPHWILLQKKKAYF